MCTCFDSDEELNVEITCPICFKKYKNNKTRLIDCNHCFCRDCIIKWKSRNNTCPMCRGDRIQIKNEYNYIFAFLSSLILSKDNKNIKSTNVLSISI